MTEQQEVTLGEMARQLGRIEQAVLSLQSTVAPMGELRVRVQTAESDIEELQGDMKAVRRDAAMVSGGLGVIGFLASWLHK